MSPLSPKSPRRGPGSRPSRSLAFMLSAIAATAGAAFVRPASAVSQEAPANAPEAQTSSQRFLRFDKDPVAGGLLETSIVTYENEDGVMVDLIGAVHVGDGAYYDLLNERFAEYDSLLYEMVKPKDVEMAAPRNRAAEDVPFGMQLIGTLQKAMQMALELDFQVEAIDYSASNFVHADMDMETFMQMQDERGEGFLQMFLEQMLKGMSQQSDPDYQPVSMFEIMDAMNATDRARRLKLLFARELSRMEDMTGMMGEDSVILGERNKKAVEVLDRQIAAGDRRIGIFYGAAHMPGIEKLMVQRGFHQVGEPDYLTAWDMTPDGSGQRAMRERMRTAIVENAVGDALNDDQGAGGNRADAASALLAGMKEELQALRRENEALRRQLETLRSQTDALRERLEQTEQDEQ